MNTTSRRAENLPDRISSWTDLSTLVEHFSYFSAHDWLYRGVTDATYDLVPKIGRPDTRAIKEDLATKTKARVPYRADDEVAVFQMFKQQARSHLSPSPVSNLEWLAVAQHFGLPTRLLDWTESLLVAAWFAVEKAGAKSKKADAAIWVTRGVSPIEAVDTADPFEDGVPKIYRPAYVSPRIAAQASVLMLCPQPTQAVKPQFVHKIVIARDVEFLLKKRLNACGINKRSLFPDLAGLAEHLSWLHKQDYLAGYRERDPSCVGATPDDSPEEA
jgi:hypothetical protein